MKHGSNVIISRKGKAYLPFSVLQFFGVLPGEEIRITRKHDNLFIEISCRRLRGSVVHIEERGIETLFFIRSKKIVAKKGCNLIVSTRPIEVGGEWGSLLYELIEI